MTSWTSFCLFFVCAAYQDFTLEPSKDLHLLSLCLMSLLRRQWRYIQCDGNYVERDNETLGELLGELGDKNIGIVERMYKKEGGDRKKNEWRRIWKEGTGE